MSLLSSSCLGRFFLICVLAALLSTAVDGRKSRSPLQPRLQKRQQQLQQQQVELPQPEPREAVSRQQRVEDFTGNFLLCTGYIEGLSGTEVSSYFTSIDGDWAGTLIDYMPPGSDGFFAHCASNSQQRSIDEEQAPASKRGPQLTNEVLPGAPFQEDMNTFYYYVLPLRSPITVNVSTGETPLCFTFVSNTTGTPTNRTICNGTTPDPTPPVSFTGAISDTNEDGVLYDDLTSLPFKGGVHIAQDILNLAEPLLAYGCDAAPEGANVILCALDLAAKILVMAASIILDMAEMQDGMVRTGWLIGTNTYANTAHNALECIAPDYRGMQGCNGADDNCNFQVDECGEDLTAPVISVSNSGLSGWFASSSDAVAAVVAASSAVDDCNTVTITTPALSGSCANTVATFSATDSCSNKATRTVGLWLDTVNPTVTCSLNPHRSDWVPAGGLLDVGFNYTANDNCVTPTVEITVRSNKPPTRDHDLRAYVLQDVRGVFRALHLRNYKDRAFTIYATVTDGAGNTAVCSQVLPAVTPIPGNPDFVFSVPVVLPVSA